MKPPTVFLGEMTNAEVEAFLLERVYRHPTVQAMAADGQRRLRALFATYCQAPEEMSGRFAARVGGEPVPRVVGDYLAGMTDRCARKESERLFQAERSV